MHNNVKYSLIGVVLMALLLSASCSKKGRVIPEDKFSEIYAEMFLADQWLTSHYSERTKADTTLFYEPIFRKYGYSLKDYDASVKHYIRKPDDYAKMLKTTSLRLDKKANYLKKVDDYYSKRRSVSPYEPKNFDLQTLMAEDTMMRWHISDTARVVEVVESADTLSDKPCAPIDSLAGKVLPDSAKVFEKTLVLDTVAKGSSLRNIAIRERSIQESSSSKPKKLF